VKPGYGIRHPGLLAILDEATPVAVEETTWAPTTPVRTAAYLGEQKLPDDLVVSVRCLVAVDRRVVVCQNADGVFHAWPGGRRQPSETHAQTAAREVLEETGWLIDTTSLKRLGWLHLQHLRSQPPDHPYPHPDWLQVVYTAPALQRVGGPDISWTDKEGYELTSQLCTPEEAIPLVTGDPLCAVFLRALRSRVTGDK
jgi:8-oxo-dGTP pyrophosphatase MutT (NUDIX family)